MITFIDEILALATWIISLYAPTGAGTIMPTLAVAAEVPTPSATPPPRTAATGVRTVRGISLAPLSDSGRTDNARHSDMVGPDQPCPVNVQSANCVRKCRLEAEGFRLHDLLRVSDRHPTD